MQSGRHPLRRWFPVQLCYVANIKDSDDNESANVSLNHIQKGTMSWATSISLTNAVSNDDRQTAPSFLCRHHVDQPPEPGSRTTKVITMSTTNAEMFRASSAEMPPWLQSFPTVIGDRVAGTTSRMKWLLSYDIREPKRLGAIFRLMKDFGRPVLFSVFECLLSDRELEQMWQAVCSTIDQKVDWVVLYRLHRPFDEAVRHIGHYAPELADADDIVFV